MIKNTDPLPLRSRDVANMLINRAQFQQWIKMHHGALYQHAYWMTANRETAKDLVQDTYYQAWKYRSSLRDQGKVLPWLLMILRRIVYKECGLTKTVSLEDIELDSITSTPHQNVDEFIDLERQLESLSTSQREVLLLYTLHGFSYEEISEQLDIPRGTVMSRLSRARKSMNLNKEEIENSNIIPFKEQNRSKNDVGN